MLILGLDTTSVWLSVGLIQGTETIAEYTLRAEKAHSRELLPVIDEVYRRSGLAKDQTEALAVATGPGSFTGIRIGLSTAQTLAHALGRPVYGVPSLDGLALNLSGFPGLVCPMLDARRREVYTGLYRVGDLPRLQGEIRGIGIEDLIAELRHRAEPVAFLGEGAVIHRQTLTEALGPQAFFPPEPLFWPRGANVAFLGALLAKGGISGEPLALRPFYLRPPAVQRI